MFNGHTCIILKWSELQVDDIFNIDISTGSTVSIMTPFPHTCDKILADRLPGRHSLKQRADHLESTLLFTTLLHHAMPPIPYTATLSIKSTYLLSPGSLGSLCTWENQHSCSAPPSFLFENPRSFSFRFLSITMRFLDF